MGRCTLSKQIIMNLLKDLARLEPGKEYLPATINLYSLAGETLPAVYPSFVLNQGAIMDFIDKHLPEISVLKIEKIKREDGSRWAYITASTKFGHSHSEGVTVEAALCSLAIKMLYARQPVVIMGIGHQSNGGGFEAITVNGQKFSPVQIAEALGITIE